MYKFRKGEIKDIPKIIEFVKMLGEYEKLSNEIVATNEDFLEYAFNRNNAQILFALNDELEEVGVAIYFYNFSTFLGRAGIYLEDLFVLPKYRGMGYGKALLRELSRLAVKDGLGRVEWSCLDWNTPSINFYKSLGARPMDEWTVYRLDGNALKEFSKGE